MLSGGLVPVAVFVTFIAKRRPSGPQPAAYGHIQTLTDLVDEWLPTMYWGHKGDDGVVCHAGASIPPSEENRIHFFSLCLRYKWSSLAHCIHGQSVCLEGNNCLESIISLKMEILYMYQDLVFRSST